MVLFTRDPYPEGKEEQVFKHYKGPLSTYSEWHSLGIGYYHGVSEDKEIPRQVLIGNPDVKHEPHFAKIGFVLGVVSKWVGLAALGGFLL